jgi:FKBP-type peptidyl-prolyl cis-trans isomerase
MVRFCSITPITLLMLSILTFSSDVTARQEETPPASASDGSAPLQQEFTAQSLNEKANYLIGYNFAQELKTNSIEIDMDQLFQGIRDAAAGNPPPMSDEEIMAVQQAFQKSIAKKQQEEFAKTADDNQRAGMEFLKKNALVEGVKELENGVQYSIVTSGAGTENPRLTDRVKVHYKGTFIDGTVFESTFGGSPAVFNVGGVIRGFSSALQQMKVGDKWMVYIPGDLAYGAGGNPPVIGPNQTLVYELELVEIIK